MVFMKSASPAGDVPKLEAPGLRPPEVRAAGAGWGASWEGAAFSAWLGSQVMGWGTVLRVSPTGSATYSMFQEVGTLNRLAGSYCWGKSFQCAKSWAALTWMKASFGIGLSNLTSLFGDVSAPPSSGSQFSKRLTMK